ncbi:hypothetical protein C0995_014644, partial [Termitomyces sp. Mi166
MCADWVPDPPLNPVQFQIRPTCRWSTAPPTRVSSRISSHKRTLLQVSTALGGADEALGRYADAVEECREQLKRIKELEEDVGVVVRDREILVTRLIKASKSQKNLKSSHRDSLQLNLPIHTEMGSASSLSLSSGFSSPSQTQSMPISTTAPSSKLSAAQAELQACEATLAQKERALQLGRVEALKEGLGMRCRALMECGWLWAEAGKEALRALEVLQDGYSSFQGQVQANDYTPFNANGHEVNDRPLSRQNRSSYIAEKPLPLPYDHQHPPYNLASQSQQPDSHTYYIPPAHAISDSEPFPTSSSYAPHQPNKQRHVLPRRITEENLRRRTSTDEEADGDGGSSDDEAEPEVRAIDNPRYVPSEPTAPSSSPGHSPFKFSRQSVSSGTGEQPQPQTPSSRKEKGKG